jgi:hypothetical protein
VASMLPPGQLVGGKFVIFARLVSSFVSTL